MSVLWVLPAAYLLGSLAWSLWAGRLRGVDLRQHGSGNLGATNVYRVLGAKAGIVVLLLDILKGTAAVLLARAVSDAGWLAAAAALAAVAGHMFTPFAGFRGGKGVATGLGVFLGLAPAPALAAGLVFAATLTLGGWVSVASVTAAVVLPVFVFATRHALDDRFGWVFGLGILLAALVVVRHRSNWDRLRTGTEQAIWENRPETPDAGAAPEGGAS